MLGKPSENYSNDFGNILPTSKKSPKWPHWPSFQHHWTLRWYQASNNLHTCFHHTTRRYKWRTPNSKDTGSLNCTHPSPMVSTPWVNWKCLLFRLLPRITPLCMHFSVYPTPLQPPWDSSPNLLTRLSPQPITQLPLLHPDYNTFYSNHCHNGQGQPPLGHRAKCLMSGGRGLPKPHHTHATTPVSCKHQFSSAKLQVSMFDMISRAVMPSPHCLTSP